MTFHHGNVVEDIGYEHIHYGAEITPKKCYGIQEKYLINPLILGNWCAIMDVFIVNIFHSSLCSAVSLNEALVQPVNSLMIPVHDFLSAS